MAALMLSQNIYPITVAEIETAQQQKVSSQWEGKRVAILGDSISDKKRVGTTKCWWEYLAENLGIKPEVYAINGNQWNGILKQAEKLLLEKGQDIDAILIFAGTNDYNSGLPIGSWYNESIKDTEVAGPTMESRKHRDLVFSDNTFKGRINKALDFLKEKYPTKQIILITPIHRAKARFNDKNIQPDEMYPNKIGKYVDEYVNTIKEASNVWAVPVIDLNAISGLYPLKDSNIQFFHKADTDRLHPNAEGHKRMALSIQYQLLGYPASFE